MPKIVKNGTEYCSTSSFGNASEILFDNSNTELNSETVQSAIVELSEKAESCFQSVSDGKALVASAITDKKVTTDATATFEEMAANISAITLGSGNAVVDDVLAGKTFTNDDGVEYTGTMVNKNSGYTNIKSDKMGWDATNHLWCYIPLNAYYTTAHWLRLASDLVASKIGLTAAKLAKGVSILGITGTYTSDATATAAQISAGYTAYVNGVKITGTRPAAITKQSGSVTFTVGAATSSGSKTTTYLVVFPSAFDKVPTVTASATQYGSHYTVSTYNITQTSFYINVVNHTLYGSVKETFNWVAQA